MKTTIKSSIATLLLFATLNLGAVTSRAAQPTGAVAAPVATTAPRIVSSQAPLSAQELAKYQRQASASNRIANDNAAGAGDNKAVWIVVGVLVVAGVIALAAGGGGGGGGGY